MGIEKRWWFGLDCEGGGRGSKFEVGGRVFF